MTDLVVTDLQEIVDASNKILADTHQVVDAGCDKMMALALNCRMASTKRALDRMRREVAAMTAAHHELFRMVSDAVPIEALELEIWK